MFLKLSGTGVKTTEENWNCFLTFPERGRFGFLGSCFQKQGAKHNFVSVFIFFRYENRKHFWEMIPNRPSAFKGNWTAYLNYED